MEIMSMYLRLHRSEIKEINIEKNVSSSRHGCSKLYPRATPPLLGSRPRSFFFLLDPFSPLPFTLLPPVHSSPCLTKSPRSTPSHFIHSSNKQPSSSPSLLGVRPHPTPLPQPIPIIYSNTSFPLFTFPLTIAAIYPGEKIRLRSSTFQPQPSLLPIPPLYLVNLIKFMTTLKQGVSNCHFFSNKLMTLPLARTEKQNFIANGFLANRAYILQSGKRT